MSMFENLIQIDERGNVKSTQWIEWTHRQIGITHCKVCEILNKCWFDDLLKPPLPHHHNCHCIKQLISKPIPEITSRAVCDIRKFNEYIFSEKYAWNGKKTLFESLGFTINDSENLKSEFERQAYK